MLGFAGWLCVASLPAAWALGQQQNAGEPTRHGIFLLPDALISRSWFDITMIPREKFRGLAGNALRYEFKGQVKSFTLSQEWVSAAPGEPAAAIAAWGQAQPTMMPPPLP